MTSTSTCPSVPAPPPSCGKCGCSGDICPVDLATGASEHGKAYLETSFGGFEMAWYNLFEAGGAAANPTRGLGRNWTSPQFAYLLEQTDGTVMISFGPGRQGDTFWFHLVGEDQYAACYGCLETLTKDGNGDFRLTRPDGSVFIFDGTDHIIKSAITAGGQVTSFTYNATIGRITEMRRTYTEDSETTVESRAFEYFSSSDPNVPNELQYVTLRRAESDTNPQWTELRRVELVYYTSTVSGKGNVGDVKLVKEQLWDGVGSQWVDNKVTYYRYYTANSSPGYQYGLKFVLSPEGYQRMSDPEGATDTQLAEYASLYYEYDSNRRATKASVEGGLKTYTMSYSENTNLSSYAYNHWLRKAVMTSPDSSTKTVYSNHIGQDMLVDHADGSNHWITYTKYNDDARVIEVAEPSAIDMSGTPYNEADDNLNVQLKSSAGLIQLTTYYATTGSGAAAGYPEYEQVKKGSSGTAINLTKTEYVERKINAGTATEIAIYPVEKQITYRSDSGGGDPVTTSMTYTWHSGTVQVATVSVALPDVPASENGVNAPQSDTIVQEFDIQGQMTKQTDARGTVTEYEYDLATGAQTKLTQDVGTGRLNLVTEYVPDDLGRITRTLGPAHNINGQTVRTATWTIYQDADDEVWNARGYRVGTTDWLVNPVSIQKLNKDDQVMDEVSATRGTGVEDQGALSASDDFSDQADWTRWTHHEIADSGRLASTRVYDVIPATGNGSSGTNYDQTDFAYSAMGRQNYVQAPGGTITRTVYDVRGQEVSQWIGTDDTDATDSDPTGGGATGNNMKKVTANEYDDGEDGGDGNLTKVTRPVDDTSSNDRVVEHEYDWRDRLVTTITDDGSYVVNTVSTLDNLGRATAVENKRDDSGNLVLIGKRETKYDTRGRVYRTLRYAVSDSGTAGNSLADNTWYDAGGNVLKSQPGGSQRFMKSVYDALSRPTNRYTGYYSGTGTDDPESLTDNVIFEESASSYDDAGNLTLAAIKQRFHNATGTGALNGPSGSQPKSRDSYMAIWYDGIGRQTETGNYGTNAGSAPTRPASAPASSDTVLVSEQVYNAAGQIEDQIDAAGKTTRSEFDAVGRVTKVTKNHGSTPTEVVRTEYTADGQVENLIAENSDTGDQTTTYTYGVTLTNSKIASNDLLAKVTYPDHTTSDPGEVFYEYNRQGERIQLTDQNETVHNFEYDQLGRLTDDKVTLASGSDVDDHVLRVERVYDNRRRLKNVTSHSATSGGSVRGDIQYAYNDFGQLATEYQQHGAAVSTSTSPKVQYGYSNGSADTIRRESITYPDGNKVVNYDYGTSGGDNDALSRIEAIKIGTTHAADYDYLGLNQVVIETYTEQSTDVEFTLATGTGDDPYDGGLDRFGRVIDLQWNQGSSELVRLKHGYDRVGNRLYRRDEVARANSEKYDELYAYDGLHRLIDFDRGELNSTNTTISSATLTQDWELDATGNWAGFEQGIVDALDQTRTHTKANEIDTISETVGASWIDPEHDANGNMIKIPRPSDLSTGLLASWDAWNRLVKLETDETTPKTVAGYDYDGQGRRVVKKSYDSSGSLDQTRHVYYSDRFQVLEEDVEVSGSSDQPERQFVWGLPYIDDLILRDRDSNGDGTLNERLYSMQDVLFSVAATIGTGSSAVKERFVYEPYGKSKRLNSTYGTPLTKDLEWEYRFTGRELDYASGLYYYRARYLHAELGRFLSRDEDWQTPGDYYSYVANNPTNYVDPTGYQGSAQQISPTLSWSICRRLAIASRQGPAAYQKALSESAELILLLTGISMTLSEIEKKFGRGKCNKPEQAPEPWPKDWWPPRIPWLPESREMDEDKCDELAPGQPKCDDLPDEYDLGPDPENLPKGTKDKYCSDCNDRDAICFGVSYLVEDPVLGLPLEATSRDCPGFRPNGKPNAIKYPCKLKKRPPRGGGSALPTSVFTCRCCETIGNDIKFVSYSKCATSGGDD